MIRQTLKRAGSDRRAVSFAAMAVAAALSCVAPGGQALTLDHRYSFSGTAEDSVGGADGVLINGAATQNGAVVLNGFDQYVDLPNGLVAGYTSITIEVWVLDDNSGSWARIIDFGNSSGGEDFPIGSSTQGTSYMFMSSQSGPNTLRASYTVTGGGSGEQIVDYPGTPVPDNVWTHVVWVTDAGAQTQRLYVDGVQVGINTATTLSPADLGFTVNNWIGRSQWNDPLLRGEIDEFRIYDGVMSADQVLQNLASGPDQLPFAGPVQIVTEPANLTVDELQPARFVTELSGTEPIQIQWTRNGISIPGATQGILEFDAALADDQAIYQLLATNVHQATTYVTSSDAAVLTVLPDLTAPNLDAIRSLGLHGVVVLFSEPVVEGGATNLANYLLTGSGGPVSLTGVTLSPDGRQVTLDTPSLTEGEPYVLSVSQLQDRSAAGNRIAPGTEASFTATRYVLQDIGTLGPPGRIEADGSGFTVTTTSSGTHQEQDQFTFASEAVTGNFDRRIRVASIGLSDVWAGAGLMARAGMTPDSQFAAIFATPGPGGCYVQSRTVPGNDPVAAGFFPANHPYTWLRLQRTGNRFTGYAGIDGAGWVRVADVTVTMPATVHLGLAAASGDGAQSTTARFEDVGAVTDPAITSISDLPLEPMGPSSRNLGVVISEIMYHPLDRPGQADLEFVELHNPEGVFEDLGGFRLDGDIDFTFPPGTRLPAGGYLVVAADPAGLVSAYGITNVAGPFVGDLSNRQGTVRLRNELGGVMLETVYDTYAPWPEAADGTGHSLVLRRPSYGERDSRAWGLSEAVDGSPGRGDGVTPSPLGGLCINEFLAHTDDPLLDQVELYNRGDTLLDLDGVTLSDQPDTNRFVIPPGTTLAPGRFLVFDQNQLGFAFSAAGGWICLKDPSGARVLDAVQYRGQDNGVSSGRSPDGAPGLSPLAARTFGSPNPRRAVSDVGINELMAHPISGDDDDQYVELHNRSQTPVDLSGWSFTDGITYNFPPGVSISAGGYLVIARDRARMLSHYPGLSPGVLYGNFGGRLSHRGERVALSKPDEQVVLDDLGRPVTNIVQIVVDEVSYSLGGRWGRWADAGGSSLELIDPRADKQYAPSWADSDESAKAPWTLIEATGVLDHGMNTGRGAPNRFEMLLQGEGECLVDDVECRQDGGANRISNPGFESGDAGWVAQGTHHRSRSTADQAFSGGRSLHVVTSGRGDTGANRLRTAISELGSGQTGTLRARARWLKGNPHVLLRLRGNWLEAPGHLTVPTDLGTPGAINSRWIANAPPAVVDVAHHPVLPAAGEPVRITARVDDPDGIASVTLTYRLDPSGSPIDLAMAHQGAGIYAGTVPGQADGALVAFSIQARDLPGRLSRFPDSSPEAEGLILFGDEHPFGSYGSYHAWCTQDTLTTWGARERNSNDPLPCTFTYGQSRVIYGASMLYSGSPFHTSAYNGPLGHPCDYELEFPGDDLFLGTDDFVLAVQNPAEGDFFQPDRTVQSEATAYWIGRQLGQIYNHKRWVRVTLNGRPRLHLYEDSQQPNADLLDVYFPDHPDARLHKIEDWFEFDDSGTNFDYLTASLLPYTTTGGEKKLARYRWTWRPRAAVDPNEFSALYSLIDVVNAPAPEPYTSRTEGLIDLRRWLGPIAVHHIVGDWDSYGYRRGKNMYAYRPGEGPWRLLLWDLDFSLGGTNADGPTHDLFDTSGGGPMIARMFNHPPFRREYLSILQDAATGPLAPGIADPLLDARFRQFQHHQVPAQDPASIKNFMALRRAYILSQMPPATFGVDGPTSRTISGNLLTLTGDAPIDVRAIRINGVAYPATWTGVTQWTLQVPVLPGAQTVVIQALDRENAPLPGAGRTLNVTSSALPALPRDWVVINEIMHHPTQPGAAYVEIYNGHPTAVFDLSGWRINGLNQVFPAGSWIPSGGIRVLAADRFAYARAYGALTPLAAEYGGTLDPSGETLTLFRPGTQPGTEEVVDRVRYEAGLPWPDEANQPGTALQLVDAAQDNSRVGNWAVGDGGTPIPAWRQVTALGNATSSRLYIYLESAGDIYLDDITLVAGSQPGAGPNLLTNGDFESPLSGTWSVAANLAGSSISTHFRHGGQSSLHLVASSGGSSSGSSISQYTNPDLVIGQPYALSFWYRESTQGGPLVLRLSSSGIRAEVDPAPPSETVAMATPGELNSVAGVRAPFPPLWLNELQVEQTTGPTNAAGDLVPWIELLHTGASTLSLDGWYLSVDATHPLTEPFSAGAGLSAGEYRILFADGRTDLATSGEWHTAFSLPAATGLVVLARNGADGPEILDYLSYSGLPTNHSYGDVPDGQPFYRQIMYNATAGESNRGAVAPIDVVITEWMADNSGAGGLVDPVDGDSDDWFELFNPGAGEADLSGYYLTDNLSTPLLYQIPPGYTIPTGGYLVVWADGEPEQNHPSVPHLHVDFRLSASGEAIGLFAPDRTPIDTVTFGAQVEDVSEGPLPLPNGPVTPQVATPGGPNSLSLPHDPPIILDFRFLPGPALAFDYATLPGATYQVETVRDPRDTTPIVLNPGRMAFENEWTATILLSNPSDTRRIYFVRRIR